MLAGAMGINKRLPCADAMADYWTRMGTVCEGRRPSIEMALYPSRLSLRVGRVGSDVLLPQAKRFERCSTDSNYGLHTYLVITLQIDQLRLTIRTRWQQGSDAFVPKLPRRQTG